MPASITLRFHTSAPVSLQEILLSMLSAALCAVGLAAMLVPIFPHISGNWPLYAICGGCLTAVFCLLLFLPPAKWISPAVSISVLAFFLIRFPVFRNGTLILANDALAFLTGRTGKIHLYFRTADTVGTLLVPILYLILFSLVCASMIRKKRRIFPVILLALSACSAIFGLPSSPLSVLFFSVSTIILTAAGRRDQAAIRTKTLSFLSLLVPAGLSLAASLFFFAGLPLLTGTDLFRTEQIAESIPRKLHTMRYEPAPAVLPEGDLRHFRPSDEEDTTMLRLGMTHPEKLYLRGFTADRYEDSVWGPVESSAYTDNAGLFQTLHSRQFYGQSMLAAAAEASRTVSSPDSTALSGSETEEALLLVTPINACRKYQYLPYALSDNTVLDARQIGDAGAEASGSRFEENPETDTLPYLTGSLPQWYETELALSENSSSGSVSRYLRLEQAYYDYVMEQDRQLSEEAAAVCAELFGTEVRERRLSDILTLVRETLDSGFTYEPDADPLKEEAAGSSAGPAEKNKNSGEQDAFTAFLVSGRGSSVHFATAAALMLRYLGVPARYVEGYFLPGEEAASFSPEDTILLTAGHAHAWAEFYLRGIGWIPFETTPGYTDTDELSLVTSLAEQSPVSSGSSPLYAQTEVLYTSGIHKEASPLLPAKLPEIPWKPEYLLYLFLLIDEYLVIFALTSMLVRRRQFRKEREKFLQQKRSGDYRQAVAMEFSYASLLIETGHLPAPPGLERMRQLNEEALFSTHPLTEAQMQEAESFTKTVLQSCRKKWSLKERFYYRWIRCLY